MNITQAGKLREGGCAQHVHLDGTMAGRGRDRGQLAQRRATQVLSDDSARLQLDTDSVSRIISWPTPRSVQLAPAQRNATCARACRTPSIPRQPLVLWGRRSGWFRAPWRWIVDPLALVIRAASDVLVAVSRSMHANTSSVVAFCRI